MATSVEIEKQFLRLIMFSHKVSLPVVRTFFVSGVLGCPDYKNDICTFLEHHKHQIFHLVGDYKCCKCNNLPSLQKRSSTFRLGNDQFKKLYEIGHSQPGHFLKGSGGRVFQQCLCCVTVWKETNPKTYDISLLITILYNCVQLSENNRLWLDTIRTCRNRLCHLNDLNELSEIELHILWGNLEYSVLRLAAEVPSQPDYKESIELLVDTFRYADYSRETITPIMEAMKLEINNNINGVIQNQISAQEEIRCLTTYVEQLSQNCKKDTQDMLKYVSESARTIVYTHQDAFHQLSAQVAQANFEQVENLKYQKNAIIESSQTVAGTMEHVVDKIDFLVDIINNKSQCTENDEALHKSGPTQKVSTPPEHKCNEDSILAKDTQRCKLRWRIETPGHLENKKDDIIQAMKKSIEIINIGTSYKIEDIYDGAITIDTLLPMSILQDKKAFHRSIRQFLDTMVSISGIDKTIPLAVKVQINFADQEQESVQYSIEEKKHTTMINKSVNAVPTMNDISTETCESEAHNKIGSSDSHNWTENASMVRILRFKTKDSYGHRRYFSNSLRHSIFDNKEEEEEGDLYDDFILLMGNIIEIQRFLSDLSDLDNISEMELIFLPLRKLRRKHIKSIICILAKSSCEEDLLYPNVKELECWPYDVVTVVRANMSIPNLLKGTKRIYDTDIQWPSHVLDVMNKTLSMVYVLQFSDKKDDENDKLILLIGNTEEVNRFYSAMVRLEDDFNSEMKLEHVPSGQIEKTTIKTIICIVSKSSKVEEFVLQHKIADSDCWPNDVVTVLWDKMTVPKFLGGTKHIRNTGEDDKWISDVMDEIKRTTDNIGTSAFKAISTTIKDDVEINGYKGIKNKADNIGTSAFKAISTTVKDDVEINGYKGIKNKDEFYQLNIVCDDVVVDCIIDRKLKRKCKKTVKEFQECIEEMKRWNETQSDFHEKVKEKFQNFVEKQKSCLCQYLLNTVLLKHTSNNAIETHILVNALYSSIENDDVETAKFIGWQIARNFLKSFNVHVYDIWLASLCSCSRLQKKQFSWFCSTNVTIVIMVPHRIKEIVNNFSGLPIKQISYHCEIFKEAEVISKERSKLLERDRNIQCHVPGPLAEKLFNNHRRLSLVCPSEIKSMDFRDFPTIPTFLNCSCIQLYCHVKGAIPIGERHFPVELHGIKTDVIEGFPRFSTKHIRIGDSVTNLKMKGTLGGFCLFYGKEAFLTCAHVMMDWNTLLSAGHLQHRKPKSVYFQTGERILDETLYCGRVVSHSFTHDNPQEISTDVAVVELDNGLCVSENDYVNTNGKGKVGYKELGLKHCYLQDGYIKTFDVLSGNNVEVVCAGAVLDFNRSSSTVCKVIEKVIERENLQSASNDLASCILEKLPTQVDKSVHMQVYAIVCESREEEVKSHRTLRFYNQLAVNNIPFQQGDSGAGVYITNRYLETGCLGMAIADCPGGGCIVTPMATLLKKLCLI